MIKLNFYIRKKPGMSSEAFAAHWQESHGPLWAEYAEALGVRRYVQVLDMPDDPVAVAYKEGYAVKGEAYDGYSVASWAELAVLEDALNTPEGKEAWAAIFEDEKLFVIMNVQCLDLEQIML